MLIGKSRQELLTRRRKSRAPRAIRGTGKLNSVTTGLAMNHKSREQKREVELEPNGLRISDDHV